MASTSLARRSWCNRDTASPDRAARRRPPCPRAAPRTNRFVAPGADARLAVGRDVGRRHDAERRLDRPAAGKGWPRPASVWQARAVAERWRDSGRARSGRNSAGPARSDLVALRDPARPEPPARTKEAIAALAIRRAALHAWTSGPGFFRYCVRIASADQKASARNRAGRVVAGVLRKGARAHDEQVRHVPALQIAVERAGLRVRPHDRAAAQMRRLVLGDVVGPLAIFLLDLLRAHRLDDLGELVGQEAVLLELVVVEVDRHAHQRAAEAVLVGRVEVEIDVAVAVEAAVDAGAGRDRAEVVVLDRRLPFRAPARRARRHGRRLDRPSVGLHLAHVAAADEAVRAMVEIVAVEFVDAHADRAGGDERIEVEFLLVEEADRRRRWSGG